MTPVVLGATAVGGLLSTLVTLYIVAIFLVILFSWFPMAPDSPMYSVWRFVRQLTDPVLMPVRKAIPPVGGVLDLSPMIVMLVLQFLVRPLVAQL